MRKTKAKAPYRSMFEERFAKWLRRHKIKFMYEPFKLEYFLTMRGSVCSACGEEDCVKVRRWYIPDFYLPEYGIIIETKGKFVSKDRTKILAVIENNPDEDIRLLFQRDNWFTRKRATRYSDWCERNGILYHVDATPSLPDDWLEV